MLPCQVQRVHDFSIGHTLNGLHKLSVVGKALLELFESGSFNDAPSVLFSLSTLKDVYEFRNVWVSSYNKLAAFNSSTTFTYPKIHIHPVWLVDDLFFFQLA